MANPGGITTRRLLGTMLVLAVVMGVAIAGIALPFAAVVGIGARQAARAVDSLPASFNTGDLEETTHILDANGNVIATLYDQNRVYRPLNQISPTMVKAILSIEDYRFYQHGAIDLKGTLRAFITDQANGGVVQGGSSITQQLVKLTLLYQATTPAERRAATADSYTRKLRELRYAIALEQTHTKNWILERYLNTAYFGDGAFGVQAAAEHYFGINASQLDVKQSALLAGLVKNPTAYDPLEFPSAAITRRNTVLARMAQLNVITNDDAERLEKTGLALHPKAQPNGCVDSKAPFFCDYVISYLLQDKELGATLQDRKTELYSGGLTIQTTMKPANERAATRAVETWVHPTDQAIGALAEVQPGTGDVLALAQSRPMGNKVKKGQTFLNYTIPKEYGGTPGFQAGSTFKLFVLAAAIEDGLPLSTTFDAETPMTFNLADYANCPGQPPFAGTWTVHNETGHGVFNMFGGFDVSINTYFTQLEQKTGVCKPYSLAKKMGVQLTDPNGAPGTHAGAERVPSFTLGIPDATPLEMAGAYATVAARGKYCAPRPVTQVLDSKGKVISSFPTQCKQVLPQWVADAVNEVAEGVQEPGGFGYDLGGTELTTASGQTIPSAGKTGTTQDDEAVWFDGYTPQIATSAMIAGANEQGHPLSLDNVPVGGYIHYGAVSGSQFAGKMWSAAMHPIQHSLTPVPFVAPPASVGSNTLSYYSTYSAPTTP